MENYQHIEKGLYSFAPKNANDLMHLGQNIPDDCISLILNLAHFDDIPAGGFKVIVKTHSLISFYINICGKVSLRYLFETESLFGILNIFDSQQDIKKIITGNMPYSDEQGYIELRGTLKGEKTAKELFALIMAQENPVFIHLDQCYSWDVSHADKFKETKAQKKVCLIRKYQENLESLFYLRGEIFYLTLEEAKEKAKKRLEEEFRIVPKYQRYLFSDDISNQELLNEGKISQNIIDKFWENKSLDIKNAEVIVHNAHQWTLKDIQGELYLVLRENRTLNIYECNVIEINGYVSNDKGKIKRFIKELNLLLQRKNKICVDIRDLYSLSEKATISFLEMLKWIKGKREDFEMVIVATLPRNDYLTKEIGDGYEVHSVIGDLYHHGLPVVTTPEDASFVFSTLSRPQFEITNTSEASLMRISGNIVFKNDVRIFEQEARNLTRSAFSGYPLTYNTETNQKIVFFDFRSLPCPPIGVLDFIISLDSHDERLIKIILGDSNLKELFKLLYEEDILCYQNEHMALEKHLRRLLIISEKRYWEEDCERLIDDFIKRPQTEYMKIQIIISTNLDHIGTRLREHYDLVIVDIKNMKSSVISILERYRKSGKKILEVKNEKDGWLELCPYQIESDANVRTQDRRIVDSLLGIPYRGHRFLFQNENWEVTKKNILEKYLKEKELNVLCKFFSMECDRYEVILMPEKNEPEKILFQEWDEWGQSFCFHLKNKCIELTKETKNIKEIIACSILLADYVSLPEKEEIAGLLPMAIHQGKKRVLTKHIAFANFFGIVFQKLPRYRIFSALTIIRLNTPALFKSYFYAILSYLKLNVEKNTQNPAKTVHLFAIFREVLQRLSEEVDYKQNLWITSTISFETNIIFQINNISSFKEEFIIQLIRQIEDFSHSNRINIKTPLTFLKFRKSDFDDLQSFTEKIKTSQDVLSLYLRNQIFSSQELTSKFSPAIEKHVLRKLNYLIQSKPLPHKDTPTKTKKKKTRRFVESAQGDVLVYHNRLFLEEYYPEDIAKSASLFDGNSIKIHIL